MKNGKLIAVLVTLLTLIYLLSLYHPAVNNITAPSAQEEQKMTRVEFEALDYGKQVETIKSMAEKDPASTWAYLKNIFIVNGQVVGNAHEFAHLIGNISFEKSGLDGIRICDPAFAFGCFHGVTEKMFLSNGLSSIKSIEEGCLKAFPPEINQDYSGCIHGVGHGVYTLEKGNLKKALADCEAFSEPYKQYCYDGAFMENTEGQEVQTFDPKNPWKFCTDLDVKYHRNCARYQSQLFLASSRTQEAGGGIKIAGKNCAFGPSSLLKETCFESLGYYIAQSALGKYDEIVASCKLMPTSEGLEICIKGGATESVFQKYFGYEQTANNLCQILSEPKKSECSANIKRMIDQDAQRK